MLIVINEKHLNINIDDNDNYSITSSNLGNQEIILENQNDANSCQFSETSKSLYSASSLGNNPMIKHKSTNLDLADSTEIDKTFQPPTDTKDE